MHEYDTALKLLLQASANTALQQITGLTVERWLSTELRQVQTRRADLLGMVAGGNLVHIELQSSNDPKMPAFSFQYTLIDIRDLDGDALLASSNIADNLLAILTILRDRLSTVRQILTRIASSDEQVRRNAFAQFLIISGVSGLEPTVKEEAKKMPVLKENAGIE